MKSTISVVIVIMIAGLKSLPGWYPLLVSIRRSEGPESSLIIVAYEEDNCGDNREDNFEDNGVDNGEDNCETFRVGQAAVQP